VFADIIIRRVPRSLFAEWTFWTSVAAWILILMISHYLSHHYTRIRYSIRLAISLGALALALVFALVAFILRLGWLFWPPIVALFAVFTTSMLYIVLQDMRRSGALPHITLSPEDQSIIDKAQELIQNLQLSKRFNPLYLTWTNEVFSDEVAFEDGFQNRNLLLPLSLKNKLSPEELRVLIAGYLLRQKTELGKFALSLVKFLGPLVIYTVVFVYSVPVIVRIPYANWAWFIGYVVIAAFGLKLLFAAGKKDLLEIDLMTAQLVGRETLLGVLEKIDNFKLHDMERLSARQDLRAKGFSFFKPNLQERIDNLART
jgi:hypothetical protein